MQLECQGRIKIFGIFEVSWSDVVVYCKPTPHSYGAARHGVNRVSALHIQADAHVNGRLIPFMAVALSSSGRVTSRLSSQYTNSLSEVNWSAVRTVVFCAVFQSLTDEAAVHMLRHGDHEVSLEMPNSLSLMIGGSPQARSAYYTSRTASDCALSLL